MAGQAQRGSRDGGPSPRGGWVAAPAAEPSAAGSGAEPIGHPSPGIPRDQSIPLGMPATPEAVPSPSATPSPWAIWRLIQMKGMSPDEAANLTAFLYGLPTADLRWSLPQLNQLLFLRQLRQAGRFGRTDGGVEPPP
jgi:hypothetical protein